MNDPNRPLDPGALPLARYIDQTLLNPSATERQIVSAAEKAGEFGFAAFCLPPCWVREAADVLAGSDVVVQTVVGFPLGFHTLSAKAHEAEEAVSNGAGEIDMVVRRGWIKEGCWDRLTLEVGRVVEAVVPVPVKAILETSELTDNEILEAARAAVRGGAAFIKTSTGFFGGAALETVKRLKEHLGGQAKIKASGGIRGLDTAMLFIEAGADRIGTSSGLTIVQEFNKNSKYIASPNLPLA